MGLDRHSGRRSGVRDRHHTHRLAAALIGAALSGGFALLVAALGAPVDRAAGFPEQPGHWSDLVVAAALGGGLIGWLTVHVLPAATTDDRWRDRGQS